MIIFELFDSLYPLGTIRKNHVGTEYYIDFKDSAGNTIEVMMAMLISREYGLYGVEFTRNKSAALTGDGDEFKIFATVIKALSLMLPYVKPNVIVFGADKSHGARSSLYSRLISKFAASNGFNLISINDLPDEMHRASNMFGDNMDIFILRKTTSI